MNIISRERFMLMLASIRGASFATITANTEPKLKRGHAFGRVRKVSRVNVTLGFQYAGSVNRQRIREDSTPDFVAMPRQWGERSTHTPILIQHKGKLYLETKVERPLGHFYMAENGEILSDEQVRPFLPTRGESRQDVAKEILVRDYAIESITGIAFQGEEYLIAPATEREAA